MSGHNACDREHAEDLKKRASGSNSDLSNLLKRVEQLEKQVAELSQRTAGQQMIGPGLHVSRLDGWPDWKRNYKLTENS